MNLNIPIERMNVDVNGLRMHALVAGEGRPLVLVHGLGTSAMCWEHNVEELSRCGRVYAVDLPGFGESEAPTTTLSAEELAERVIAWCDIVGVTGAAAAFLVELGVKVLGVDYLSVEVFKTPGAPAHHALLDGGVIVIEGLNLRDVEPGIYDMLCLPLRIVGADGAPARVVLRSA